MAIVERRGLLGHSNPSFKPDPHPLAAQPRERAGLSLLHGWKVGLIFHSVGEKQALGSKMRARPGLTNGSKC